MVANVLIDGHAAIAVVDLKDFACGTLCISATRGAERPPVSDRTLQTRISAIKAVHNLGFIHRHTKSDNMLLDRVDTSS